MEKYCPKCFKKFGVETERCPGDGTYLVSPADRDLTGQVLDDRYTVLERIGRGGMGVVYKAEQHLLKRVVALKVLRREMVQDETAVKRFMVEAQAIASLSSRFTVTLHDFGVTKDGLLYYTMELLKGQPLARLIAKEGPLEYRRAARLAMQVCDSLDEAHERGILHRDIKPENIYVVPDRRGKEEVKVLDFGIAKLVGETSAESMTKTGMIVGTPAYLSPEQAMGNPVVPASDLYSLGIVLYEMLAGSPPFLAETPMKTLWAHVKEPVPALQAKNPAVVVPRSIELFLARALDKDPGRRLQSATEFRDTLKRALEDHEAKPETVALTVLSTTDEGVRVRTDELRGTPGAARPDPAASREKPRPADGTVGYAEEGGDVAELADAGASGRPAPAVGVTQTGENPVSALGGAVVAGVASSSLPDGTQLASQTDLSLVLRSRRRVLWGGGLAVLVIGAVGLLVWNPWSRGEKPAGAPSATEGTRGDAVPPVSGRTEPAARESAPVADVLRQAADAGGSVVEEAAARKNEAETAAQTAAAEEAAKRAAEDEARKKAEAEAGAKKAAEEAAKKAADEEAARKAAQEEARKKVAAEAAAKKAAEEEEARKAAEQAAAKKAAEAEEEARKAARAEAERKRQAEEEARKRKIKDLVGDAERAMQEKRWKDCVVHLEEVVRLGGGTAAVQATLEKCRDLSVY
jgi:serine/threonine protein kinase